MATSNASENPPVSLLGRFRAWQFHAIRRLLFLWIRPTVLGADAASLGIDAGESVAYVLPFRSIVDLMVLDQACERAGLPRPIEPMVDNLEARAFFFLGRPEGRFGRRSLRRQSERMVRLFDHENAGRGPVRIVPVSLFWGHQPDQENSWFKLILSDNWSTTSRIKKFLALLLHPRHILVQFGQPVLLSDHIEQPERELQVRRLMRILRVHFTHQKQAILGPDLSHRRTLINSIMDSEAVREAISREVATTRSTRPKVEKKALGYAGEIVSDQSYRVIRFFHVLLTWLWNNLYDGIEVHGIDQVKTLAQDHEIVYIPCHRSHIDYLLLSYVLYHNGLTPPHIAAGRNLNLPIAGSLLRRAGAFYMRRSFQGDGLYKAVFDEYLHLMFVRGYSVEYFIEGGRSRTGRTLVPRTGMLSMTMRSFQRDSSRPMALMPVYFSYERIIEAPTYMSELAGKDKKAESIFDIFKIFSAFRSQFGQVAVSFGAPVLMDRFLDEQLPNWNAAPAPDIGAACLNLSRELAVRINAAAVVNPVNLVATALLCTPRQTMLESRLERQVEVLRQIASSVTNARVTQLDVATLVSTAEAVTGIERVEQPFGDLVFAPYNTSILLTYYKNNTAHIFVLPSLIARIVRTRESVSSADLYATCNTLYPYIRNELFLPWHTSDVEAICDQYIAILEDMALIRRADNQLSIPAPNTEAFACLSELAEIVEPTLERFFVVATLLAHNRGGNVKEVEADAAATARQLSAIYGINSPEFFDRTLFATFISSLRSNRHISSSCELLPGFDAIQAAAASTLDPEVRYNVLHVTGKITADP